MLMAATTWRKNGSSALPVILQPPHLVYWVRDGPYPAVTRSLPMLATLFLPDPTALALEHVTLVAHQLTLTARTTAPTAYCPSCAVPATRVHSRYRL